MFDLMLQEIRRRIGTVFGWAVGLGAFCSAYMLIYTALPEEVRHIDVRALALLESLGMQTFATFEGFMLSTVLNFLPLLTGALGVALGIATLAAEEDEGTLELLAALPLSRVRLLLGKSLAASLMLLVILAIAGLIAGGAFIALSIDTTVTALDLFGVILANWLIGFVFLALSLFLGAYLPNRGAATSAAATALLVSFFGNNLIGMAPDLEPYRPLLPHFYFDRVTGMLTADTPWRDVAILVVFGLGALLPAFLSFRRRNLTVAAWPWQRARPSKRLIALAAEEGYPVSTGNRFLAAILSLVIVAAAATAWWALAPGESEPLPPTTAPEAEVATVTPTGASTAAPTATVPPTITPTATNTSAPTATPTITPTPTPTPVTYTVQSGDTLAQIAQDHGVTVNALIEANDIADPARIEVGQVFVIPSAQ